MPPPAQGAVWVTVQSASPAIAGKSCPVTNLVYDVPHVDRQTMPNDVLTSSTYKNHIIDGQDGATVRCSVSGGSTFTFSGRIALGGKAVDISNGTVGTNQMGTARITVTDTADAGSGFSNSLVSPATSPCAVKVVTGQNGSPQVKKGSIWASYTCASVENPPSDACSSNGIFVLENCDQ
ncbi:MAG TPA: hypothetical protein VNG33_23800 [Polyangiaceae bacterium]|nr:hypothetical protein [Polyangiaceae bacterium]